MIATVALILGLALSSHSAEVDDPSVAQAEPLEIPAACQPDAGGAVDFQVCADTAPKGSMPRSLALINLASRAYRSGDYPKALSLYDEAVPPGLTVMSDVIFHTFRADTYAHVGRTEAAQADASLAWRILSGEFSPSGSAKDDLPVDDRLRFEVLVRILPILQDGDPETFAAAKAQFMALPAEDGVSLTNRAGVLATLGDYDTAISDSGKALALLPDEAGLQNNHCYILYQAGRAADGLPYCEAAVAALPQVAPIRHSYAEVLAATGRCSEAEIQIAEARRLDPSSVEYTRALACAAP
ncbi:MAG: tetratricopeptide repeat protein [Brevundimonas sp.]